MAARSASSITTSKTLGDRSGQMPLALALAHGRGCLEMVLMLEAAGAR